MMLPYHWPPASPYRSGSSPAESVSTPPASRAITGSGRSLDALPSRFQLNSIGIEIPRIESRVLTAAVEGPNVTNERNEGPLPLPSQPQSYRVLPAISPRKVVAPAASRPSERARLLVTVTSSAVNSVVPDAAKR